MKKLTGLTIFLIVLYIALVIAVPPQGFALNNYNLAERIGQYGIILPNLTNMWGVPSELEFIVIGGALLLGAILDEKLRPTNKTA